MERESDVFKMIFGEQTEEKEVYVLKEAKRMIFEKEGKEIKEYV